MPLDPTLGELSDQQSMTHGPPHPNPAAPYVGAISDFFAPFFDPAAHGGIAGALEGVGHQLPDWAAAPQSILNNPSANQAFMLEAGIPWKAEELATLKSMIASGKLDFSRLPGRSRMSIFKKMGAEELSSPITWKPEEMEKLEKMVSARKIDASQLPGRTMESIYSKMYEIGLGLRSRLGDPYVGSPSIANDPKMAGQIDKMLKQNLPYAQIISRLGISDKTLRRYLSEIGSSRRGASWNDPQRIQQYKDMIANGFTAKQMATALKTGERTVYDQLYRLTEEGHLNFVPQGGTRTPGMPSFNLPGEATGDPEYEKALAEFLQGQQSSPARFPEINVPSLEELFDQLTTKRKP